MTYCRLIMVTTRVFLGCLSRTVLTHPSLMKPAFTLYLSTRARNSKGIARYLPSRRYLAFRIYTQYGKEEVPKEQIRMDLYHYLNWVKSQ